MSVALRKIKLTVLTAFLVASTAFIFLDRLTSLAVTAQTEDPFKNWRPTRVIPNVEFVGSHQCVSCHTKEGATHGSMANASLNPLDSQFLSRLLSANFQSGNYTYKFSKRGDKLFYIVTDGKSEIAEPVLYAFGEGRAGQVFLFQHNKQIYESHVTYYPAIKSLDFTVAHSHEVPLSLEAALGRIVPQAELRSCFSCHSTASAKDNEIQFQTLQLGVSCEACHGPGADHIAAVKSKGAASNLKIFDPSTMPPMDMSQEFCGSCHVGFEQVLQMDPNVVTVRFQPYRLLSSKGHASNDPRLSCTACHDPHGQIVEGPKFYDQKCTACHATGPATSHLPSQTARSCPVGTENCVSCHMPKTNVPEMHFKFTDHWIRVVKPNERIQP